LQIVGCRLPIVNDDNLQFAMLQSDAGQLAHAHA
jgi:hypothetical protein